MWRKISWWFTTRFPPLAIVTRTYLPVCLRTVAASCQFLFSSIRNVLLLKYRVASFSIRFNLFSLRHHDFFMKVKIFLFVCDDKLLRIYLYYNHVMSLLTVSSSCKKKKKEKKTFLFSFRPWLSEMLIDGLDIETESRKQAAWERNEYLFHTFFSFFY